MAVARSPGLPRCRTSRPKPDRAAPTEPAAEFFHSRSLSELALGKGPEWAPLRRAMEAASAFPASPRALLLREAPVFFLALVFPLLSAPVSLFSWFCVQFLFRPVFSSPISVWVAACGAALISVKRQALAFPAVWALVFSQSPPTFPILRRLVLLAEWP
jgi:hypothetical protein